MMLNIASRGAPMTLLRPATFCRPADSILASWRLARCTIVQYRSYADSGPKISEEDKPGFEPSGESADSIIGKREVGQLRHCANNREVAIIGGGLTGLTAAFYLSEFAPLAKITIYESKESPGGWIQTDKVKVDVAGVKGTVNFERGPRSFSALSTSSSRFDDLVLYDLSTKLGLDPQVAPTDLKRRIYYPDHLVTLPPTGLHGWFAALSEPFYKEIAPGFFGWLKRKFRGHSLPSTDALSITDFVKHISGSQAAADNAASAVFGGIYGGDIDRIDAETALYPRLQEMWLPKNRVLNDISTQEPCHTYKIPNPKGRAGVTTESDTRVYDVFARDPALQYKLISTHYKEAKAPSLLHFGSKGLQSLPDALAVMLAAKPNVTFKTSTTVRSLEYVRLKKQVKVQPAKGSSKAYDKVIATCGAEVLRSMTRNKLPSLQDMSSVSIMTVNLWYPQKDLKPRGLGYLIPRSVPFEQNPERALGVFFDSDIGNNHEDEPEGTKLFVLMGGYHYDKPGVTIPTEAEAIQQAKTLLQRHVNIPIDTPCHAMASFKKDCIPQHSVGHRRRMKTLADELKENYGGRLSPWGGAYTRIGGLAALRDGFLAAHYGSAYSLNNWGRGSGPEVVGKPQYFEVQRGWAAAVRPRAFGVSVREVLKQRALAVAAILRRGKMGDQRKEDETKKGR